MFKKVGAGLGGVRIAAYSPPAKQEPGNAVPEAIEVALLESVEDEGLQDAILEAMSAADESRLRAECIAAVLVFSESDDIGYDDFEALAIGLSDMDGDGDVDEDEEDHFNDVLMVMGDALIALGLNEDIVNTMLDDEDDDAAEAVYFALRKALKKSDKAHDDLVADFTAGESLLLEGKMKVVRNGKVKFVRKKKKRRKINAAQRASLKKARRKSNTSSARKNRRKAMKMRKKRGM